MLQELLADRVRQRRRRLAVRAQQLLCSSNEAGLHGRWPLAIDHQGGGEAGTSLAELDVEVAARRVVADDAGEAHLGAEGSEVADDIAGAARHPRFPLDLEHRHRRLGRDAFDGAIDVAVEHDVADAADPNAGDGIENGEKAGMIGPHDTGHTSPSSRSSAPHSIWPRVMCIS